MTVTLVTINPLLKVDPHTLPPLSEIWAAHHEERLPGCCLCHCFTRGFLLRSPINATQTSSCSTFCSSFSSVVQEQQPHCLCSLTSVDVKTLWSFSQDAFQRNWEPCWSKRPNVSGPFPPKASRLLEPKEPNNKHLCCSLLSPSLSSLISRWRYFIFREFHPLWRGRRPPSTRAPLSPTPLSNSSSLCFCFHLFLPRCMLLPPNGFTHHLLPLTLL